MNQTIERMKPVDAIGASISTPGVAADKMLIHGRFKAVCRGPREEDRAQYLELMANAALLASECEFAHAQRVTELAETLLEDKWEDEFDNLVTTVGKNYLLDNGMAGSAYTAAFYIGMISSVSYLVVGYGVVAADTMAAHAGWFEAGPTNAPNYSSSTRIAAAWAAASAGVKALSAPLTYTFSGAGTVKGVFMTTVSTKDGTTGTLFSAGLFSADKVVGNGDAVNVSYSLAL